ncbi:MAG: glycoside hydrolase family 36 protein [Dehalococcoidia bacterium]|nr:glycoside hydrolase family 36 protein [Dehalococcoidia bacterium]
MTYLPWDLQFQLETHGLELADRFDPASGRYELTLHNPGSQEVRLDTVRLSARIDLPAVSGYAWLQGRVMNDDALCRIFGDELEEGYSNHYLLEDSDKATAYRSAEWLGLSVPARAFSAFILGSLDGTKYTTDISVYLDGDEDTVESIAVTFVLEGESLPAGGELELPPLYLAEGTDLYELACNYADACATLHGARVLANVPTGWCSWYSLYRDVTEEAVLANIEALAQWPVRVDVVQVDDGYQSATGDWLTPAPSFPSGMAALAGHITKAGFRPGIWLAPFVMHESSAVLRHNPEFALKTPAGEPLMLDTWLGRCAVLDCSHEPAREWLRETVRTIVHEWGYTYLKLDALVYALQHRGAVAYRDPSLTAASHLRLGLQVIREAAGDDAYLLGCTSPFAPALGLVDAMRTGPDVKAEWGDRPSPGVRHAMRMALQRNVYHRRWWLNDPDCMLARDSDTQLTGPERRFLATAIALSGGPVFSGDDARTLAAGPRRLLEAILPPSGIAAEPLDMGDDGPAPSAWRVDLGEGHLLIGILNWTDEEDWVHPDDLLEPGEIAFDAWNGRLLHGGDIHLQPHDAALLQVAPAPRHLSHRRW